MAGCVLESQRTQELLSSRGLRLWETNGTAPVGEPEAMLSGEWFGVGPCWKLEKTGVFWLWPRQQE